MLPAAAGFDNVHLLRTVADAERLREALRSAERLAVVGAGFIGQEVAATARSLGVDVTIVEAAAAPLDALLGGELGGWFADLHREEGVRMLTSTTVSAFRGNGSVEELELSDGRRVQCDAVLIGIGVAPATGWLEGSGLSAGRGPVGPGGRTALPHVYAAGDAALPFDERLGDARAQRALGGGGALRRGSGAGDARDRAAGARAVQLLVGPVRPAHPVRRARNRGRTRSSSTDRRTSATSRPCSGATACRSPRCSWAARMSFPRCGGSSRREQATNRTLSGGSRMKGFTTKLAAAVASGRARRRRGLRAQRQSRRRGHEAQKQPPVIVRTQVIRRTVRIHRKPQGTEAAAQRCRPAGERSCTPGHGSAAPAQPVVAARPAAPVRHAGTDPDPHQRRRRPGRPRARERGPR